MGSVSAWAYQLQQIDPEQIIANQTFDLIVIDYSSDGTEGGEWSPEQIQAIRESGKTAVAYLSIGEAEDYRFYWDPQWEEDPPPWLGPENPDWPGNYKVRFWYPEWRAIIESYMDRIAAQGFDGIYMDIIDAYYYWSEEVGEEPAADSLMVEFVLELRRHAEEDLGLAGFIMIPQNGEYIIVEDDVSASLAQAYLQAIDAIGIEDLFFRGDQDENNPYDPDWERIDILGTYQEEGKTVLSVEYLTLPELIQQYIETAIPLGYYPYATVRALDVLFDGIPGPSPAPEEEHTSAGRILLPRGNPAVPPVFVRFEPRPASDVHLDVLDTEGRLLVERMIPPERAYTGVCLELPEWTTWGLYLLQARETARAGSSWYGRLLFLRGAGSAGP